MWDLLCRKEIAKSGGNSNKEQKRLVAIKARQLLKETMSLIDPTKTKEEEEVRMGNWKKL